MDAKVKGQGHKVTHDENALSAENLVNATISKWHDIVKIIAQYTLHSLFQRDNKPRHTQSMSLDVSTKNSVDEPSKVTIQFEGRLPCSVSLQVQF